MILPYLAGSGVAAMVTANGLALAAMFASAPPSGR